MNRVLSTFASWTGRQVGKAHTLLLAMISVVLYSATGPYFNFSDTWQLVLNTILSVISYFLLFVLQNSQTRDAMAMQAKLDELIRATQDARNSLIDVENASEEVIIATKQSLAGVKHSAPFSQPL